ncbi:hypothetical protein BCD48_25130 [Pseudofrankia sp. BMG5.36]|nr:hypothetical protein BCD48_25130 [Pseudofrankia sp. BMG5.36]
MSGPSVGNTWIPAATKAAAKAINDAGGVNGRPIEVTVCDDQFDPNKAAACATQAVAGKYLFVTGSSGFGDRFMPILEQAKIPVVGAQPNSASELKSPYSFPFTSTLVQIAGGGTACGKQGKTKPASAVLDLAAAKALAGIFALGLKPFDLTVTKNVTIAPTATDLSTYAANLSGADCVEVVVGSAQFDRLTQAMRQADNGAVIAYGSADVSQQTIDSLGSAGDHVVLVAQQVPVSDTSVPSVKRFHDEARAAGVDDRTLTDDSMIAWAATHYVAELAKSLPSIDGASLAVALNKAGTINYDPLPKVDFSKPITMVFPGNRVFNTSVFLSEIRGGKRVPLYGNQQFSVLGSS